MATTAPSPTPSAVTVQPDSYANLIQDNPILVGGLYFILLILTIGFVVFLWRLAGMRLPFKVKKVSAAGFSAELEDGKPSSPNIIPQAMSDLMFDYADYVLRLKDKEFELLDEIKQLARDATRRHVDDFVAQIKGLNHEHFNLAKGNADFVQRDVHFNTVVKGEVKMVLTKQLLDVFDRNHLLEMSEKDYREVMQANYLRIKRMVYTTLAEDWYHPDYSFDTFMVAMEQFQDRGERDFMQLMNRYKNLAENRKEVKAYTRTKAREARIFAKAHGHMPDVDIE